MWKFIGSLMLASGGLFLASCEQDGGMEEAGEEMDEAMDEVEDEFDR